MLLSDNLGMLGEREGQKDSANDQLWSLQDVGSLGLGRCYVFLGGNVKMRRLCHCQDRRAWHRVLFWTSAMSELSWGQSSWRWAVGPWDAGFYCTVCRVLTPGCNIQRKEILPGMPPSRLPLPHQPCCHQRLLRAAACSPAGPGMVWVLLQKK